MKIKMGHWILILVLAAAGFAGWKFYQSAKSKKTVMQDVQPQRGDIEVFVTTTGTVQPQNRLEMKPPISGRVEEILVREGDKVTKGQIVAWMSSTERAALLDAARSQSANDLEYWQDAYKPTPLIAPIDGGVIVRAVEPGQTVTSADPVIVLSDRLIVKAHVDETDIGRVRLGQKARISLDAYPQESIEAEVDHTSYESRLVNNVTIYEVDILPREIPKIFRSGMSANVNITEDSRRDVLRLPVEAVRRDKKNVSVLVKQKGRAPQLRSIEIGLSGDDYVEVVSGLSENETVVIEKSAASMPKKSSGGTNPFMPVRQRNR